jgi:hypothetical protein
VVTPYSPGSAGTPVPAIPTTCPLDRSSNSTCDVRKKDQRKRKTGPCFALTVVKCYTHGRCFTLYPPGFAPYQRQPVVRLALDGAVPLGDGQEELHGFEAFESTLFEAALDAREGRAWARNSERQIPERWWSTQGRHLRLALGLLGICATLGDRLRERIAEVLRVPLLILRQEATKEREKALGYRQRGKAISRVLRKIRCDRGAAFRLLFSGYATGQWGLPLSWDPKRDLLERLPFQAPGGAAPT